MEKIVSYPIKISTMLYASDITKYRENVETKRYEAQLKLQRLRESAAPDVIGMDKLEKEIAMYDSELSRLASGQRPMGLISYLMVTGTGVTSEAAVAVAKNRAAEIKTLFSNALNVDIDYLYGEDMKKCYDIEFMIPSRKEKVSGFLEA